MTTIVTRSGKGSPLTHTEVDTNFTNLNTAKLEAGAIALGSAATPSISFTGDTNTGIYSPGADQVAVATNGTGRLFIDASGNINLGQASSALQSAGTGLTVYGASSSEIKFLNSTTGALDTDGTALVATSTDFIINNREAGFIALGTSNTERLRITSAGLVGIGTSSPLNTLNIVDSASVHNGTIRLGSSTYYSTITQDAVTTGKLAINSAATSGAVHGIQLQVDGTAALAINSSRQVGIGTTSPVFTLDCRGTIYSSVASGTANYMLGDSTNGTQSSIRTSNNNLIFSNDASNERARIDGSGRLLIGTSTANANGGILQLTSGITFPATAVAATDANTLDDYEEGTWTPSIGGDATYTSRNGTYTKVGRKVSILGSFVINIKGTGSATIVSDLPFAASALTPAYVGLFQNLAINVVFLLGTIPATTARIDFTSLSSAGGTAPNETSVIGNGTRIDFAATYFV